MENKYSICDKIFISFAPAIIAGGITFAVRRISTSFVSMCELEQGIELSKMMISVWGTLFGFLLSAESILLTLGGKKYLKALRESVHYRTILFTYFIACVHTLVAMTFFICVVFIHVWNNAFLMILVFFTCDIVLFLVLCLWFLYKLIIKSTE